MDRRQFLKIFGAGTAVTAATLAGCSNKKDQSTETAILGEIPTDKMTYRSDTHGDQISILGFGCMRFPTIEGKSGREDSENEIDQEEINRMVDYAIEHGVNLFDTSPAYCQGRSEKALGIALSRHNRSEYRVSTKLSNFGVFTREASLEMYQNSFKELQVDYLDYYLLHSVGGGEDAMGYFRARYIDNGLLDFLIEERNAGRIKNLGFSYHGDVRIFDYLLSRHDEIHWDFVLIQLNYVDWNHAKDTNPRNTNAEYLYNELDKREIPIFVMEPLLGGRLANLSDHAVELLKEQDSQASVASWAFRFAGSKPRILTVLSGMTYMEHLQDNIRTYAPLKSLNESEYQLLDEIAKIYVNFPMIPCNSCQYCMPCPYGLDIPGIFNHYNKCLNEGTIQEDRQSKDYQKARKAFLVGYDRSVPKLRQANHCVGCNKCLSPCPQRINIPAEMRRIDTYVENLKQNGADLGSAAVLAMLIRKLDEGNFSCVINKNGETRTFSQRGVKDLYELNKNNNSFLKDSRVADKVIGKGAAALIVLGGAKDVRTHVICSSAKELLQQNGIQVVFDEEVDHIINNSKTDWCPLEKLVKDCKTADECWPIIEKFVEKN